MKIGKEGGAVPNSKPSGYAYKSVRLVKFWINSGIGPSM